MSGLSTPVSGSMAWNRQEMQRERGKCRGRGKREREKKRGRRGRKNRIVCLGGHSIIVLRVGASFWRERGRKGEDRRSGGAEEREREERYIGGAEYTVVSLDRDQVFDCFPLQLRTGVGDGILRLVKCLQVTSLAYKAELGLKSKGIKEKRRKEQVRAEEEERESIRSTTNLLATSRPPLSSIFRIIPTIK